MSKRRLIIHAGMRKTGSSAIQEYLFHALDHPEFGYFPTRIPNASLLMTQSFKRDFDQLPQFRGNGWSSKQVQAIRERSRKQFARLASRCKRPTTILSAETVSSFSAEEAADLKDFAGRDFNDIQVVIYIRSPHHRAESVFQERLKNGYARLSDPVPSNFDRLGNTFDEVFGRENVVFRRFSPPEFAGGSVVADFLGFVGIPFTELPETPVNSSLTLPAVQLLYVYRKYFPEFASGDKCLVAQLSKVQGERFRMHPDLIRTVVREKPDSRNWLVSRVGIAPQETLDQDVGVRGESDLLALSGEALAWLEEQLMVQGTDSSVPDDPKGVAHRLRELVAPDGGPGVKPRRFLRRQ